MEESKALYHKPYLCIICVDVYMIQGDKYVCVCVHIYVNICAYIETFIMHISLTMYYTHQMI